MRGARAALRRAAPARRLLERRLQEGAARGLHRRGEALQVLVHAAPLVHGVLLAVDEAHRLLAFTEVGISLALVLAATYLLRGLRAAQQS